MRIKIIANFEKSYYLALGIRTNRNKSYSGKKMGGGEVGSCSANDHSQAREYYSIYMIII